jgi:predicted XRE-type DNA-binding protein
MKLRSALMRALEAHIRAKGLSQTQAAKLFGVTQPRVSDLLRARSTCSAWIPWRTWLWQRRCT